MQILPTIFQGYRSLLQFLQYLGSATKSGNYQPIYRLLEVLTSEKEEVKFLVQLINKNATAYFTPQEILENNNLVDNFSPRDVRTITYFGYLALNAPMCKIMAQRFADNGTTFLIKKKGCKHVFTKSAQEVIQEQEGNSQFNANDAQAIGYCHALENIRNNKTFE